MSQDKKKVIFSYILAMNNWNLKKENPYSLAPETEVLTYNSNRIIQNAGSAFWELQNTVERNQREN